MKWFRKHVRHGSRLALLALAIQFALSFGHFHGITAQAAPAIQTGLTQADLAYAKGIAARDTAREAAQQQQPSAPDTDQQPADACAICAVIALVHNLLIASSPPLPPPRAAERLYVTTDAEFVHLGPAHPAFQSRAPPLS